MMVQDLYHHRKDREYHTCYSVPSFWCTCGWWRFFLFLIHSSSHTIAITWLLDWTYGWTWCRCAHNSAATLHTKAEVNIIDTPKSICCTCLLSPLLGTTNSSVGNTQNLHLVHKLSAVRWTTFLYKFILTPRVVGVEDTARITPLPNQCHLQSQTSKLLASAPRVCSI